MTNDDLWTSDDCAAYMRCSKGHFLRRVAALPGFPRRIDIGRPRWYANEVREWVARQQERTAQPPDRRNRICAGAAHGIDG
mgnify:CR=1 FL=1